MNHETSPHAKVLLAAIAEEKRIGLIDWAEYNKRGKDILLEDKAQCTKGCCKPRKKRNPS